MILYVFLFIPVLLEADPTALYVAADIRRQRTLQDPSSVETLPNQLISFDKDPNDNINAAESFNKDLDDIDAAGSLWGDTGGMELVNVDSTGDISLLVEELLREQTTGTLLPVDALRNTTTHTSPTSPDGSSARRDVTNSGISTSAPIPTSPTSLDGSSARQDVSTTTGINTSSGTLTHDSLNPFVVTAGINASSGTPTNRLRLTHSSPNLFVVPRLRDAACGSPLPRYPLNRGVHVASQSVTVSTQSDAAREQFKALQYGKDRVLAAKAKKGTTTPTKPAS